MQQMRAELWLQVRLEPRLLVLPQPWQSSVGSLRNPQGFHGTQCANPCLFPCLPPSAGGMEVQTASLHRIG